MTPPPDSDLRNALRRGLGARDARLRSPPFSLAGSGVRAPRHRFTLRPVLAVAAALGISALAAALLLLLRAGDGGIGEASQLASRSSGARIDRVLASQLSFPAYWQVPTDELLAFEPAPMGFDLSSADPLRVSLEESLL